MGLQVEEGMGYCTFRVHVLPRSRRDEIAGLYGDALNVRVAAVPVRGKANRALERYLANRLGIPAAAVAVISGHTSRHKRVRVAGVSATQVLSLLSSALEDPTA